MLSPTLKSGGTRPPVPHRSTPVMAKLQDMGLSWGKAQAAAKHRTLWMNVVVPLCPTGGEEDK